MRNLEHNYSSSGEGLATLASFGLGIAAAGIWYGTYKFLTNFSNPVMGMDGKGFSTHSLGALYDRAVQKVSKKFEASISLEYEEKCLLNPLSYKGDNSVVEVLVNYQGLMSGKIIDHRLEHLPSEYLGNKFNPDYLRYLKVQKSLGLDHTWVKEELSRVKKIRQVEQILNSAKKELSERGVRDIYLEEAATLERCSLFEAEDWHMLIDALVDFDKEGFSPDAVKLYLGCFVHASNIGQMATLNLLLKYGDNIPVFIQIVEAMQEGFSSEDIKACILKVTQNGAPWESAYLEVLEENNRSLDSSYLRTSHINFRK